MPGNLFTRRPFNTSLHSRDRGQERVETKTIRVPQDTKLDSGMSESSYINVNVNNLDANTQDSLELQVLEKSQVILEPIRNLNLVNIPFPSSQMAGRLQIHKANWLKITSDQIILKYVEGIELNFLSNPVQPRIPRNYRHEKQRCHNRSSCLQKSIPEQSL